ncbi:MAG: metallophosphoesterase [Ginsengibacter sp.]
MRTPLGAFIIAIIMLLLDFYLFVAIRTVIQSFSSRTKTVVFSTYWVISILSLICLLILFLGHPDFFPKKIKSYLIAIVMALFISKFVAALFFIIDDARRLLQWVGTKIFFNAKESAQTNELTISRSMFLTWLGIGAGGTMLGSLVYGFSNKYNYQVKHIKIPFANLPAAFKGFRIIHVSDIHSGSFDNKKAVMKGVQLILDQKADLIIFSGDLVNNRTNEIDGYKDVFNKLKAPYGVFSTLGNHDYGDYAEWPFEGMSKEQNLKNMVDVHAEMGWKLMMNEHTILEKNGEKIALIGIENWGAKARFPKYGKMAKAYAGTEEYPFKILISHDPSHWDAQVRPDYGDVDLTLAGHTHGMQFGVEIPGFKWSPIQYVYKEWDGLYAEGKQKLYVNPGYGFLGYPGRVGILPEITVIELDT